MSRNSGVLADFVKYCEGHPYDRFWQALRNWSRHNFLLVSRVPPYDPDLQDENNVIDTFYWEGKDR